MFMEVNGDGDANDYLDDPDFMESHLLFMWLTIFKNNFGDLPRKEGNSGDINLVNFEQSSSLLVGIFRKL